MVEAATAAVSTVIRRNNVTVSGRVDGPVMMFAHGYGCDQDMWRRLLPYFADDYRLVLFDHVGAGHSDVNAYDRESTGPWMATRRTFWRSAQAWTWRTLYLWPTASAP